MGCTLGTMEARRYYQHHAEFREIIQQALIRRRSEFDLVVIEGAGSPFELNLARKGTSEYVHCIWPTLWCSWEGDSDRAAFTSRFWDAAA